MARKRRKPITLTSGELLRQKEEEKLLKKTLARVGYEGTRKKERKILKTDRTVTSRENYASLDTGYQKGISLEDQRYKQQVSEQFEIGQAYNKGNFQVLSRKETKEESTGKRR